MAMPGHTMQVNALISVLVLSLLCVLPMATAQSMTLDVCIKRCDDFQKFFKNINDNWKNTYNECAGRCANGFRPLPNGAIRPGTENGASTASTLETTITRLPTTSKTTLTTVYTTTPTTTKVTTTPTTTKVTTTPTTTKVTTTPTTTKVTTTPTTPRVTTTPTTPKVTTTPTTTKVTTTPTTTKVTTTPTTPKVTTTPTTTKVTTTPTTTKVPTTPTTTKVTTTPTTTKVPTTSTTTPTTITTTTTIPTATEFITTTAGTTLTTTRVTVEPTTKEASTSTTLPTTTTVSTKPSRLECGIQRSELHEHRQRVIGGFLADECEYPWMAFLFVVNTACAGTVISNRHILTAAHCVKDRLTETPLQPELVRVSIGSSNINLAKVYTVINITTHPQHDSVDKVYDAAILTVGEDIIFSKCAAPICLPEPGSDPREADFCVVAGWGVWDMSAPNSTPYLQEVQLPIVDQQLCVDRYGASKVNDLTFCAGDYYNGGIDSCQGDSGAPLMCRVQGRYVVHGIVSNGMACAVATYPGIYTRVSHPNILAFIDSVTGTS